MSAAAAPVIFDALDELRTEIEECAANGTVSPQERQARLAEFRTDLLDVVGSIDSYMGDAANEIEAANQDVTPAQIAKLRENADIRVRLIEAGETTPEDADSILLWSHETLDELAEEGLLEESAAHAAAFFGGIAGRMFDEKKHPRGRGGKWTNVFNQVSKVKEGERKHLGNGIHVKNAGGKLHVQVHRRTISTHTSAEDATHSAVAALEMPPTRPKRRRTPAEPSARFHRGDKVEIVNGRHKGVKGTVLQHHDVSKEVAVDTGERVHLAYEGHVRRQKGTAAGPETASTKDWIRQGGGGPEPSATERAAAKDEVAARAAEKNLSPDEKARLYQERRAQLEQRASSAVASAAQRGKLSDAEAHFNDAGKVSQRTLANYVEEASTKPQTIDMYSKVDAATGQRVWDRSRQQLHERIIAAHLKERAIHPDTGKPVLDYSPGAKDLQPHADGPRVLFSGGGYAAGKGGVIKILAARGETPPDSFTLDPDQIKAELPEFAAMIGTDPEANMHVYREAWAIAQEIQARAMERKLNIVVDGISNTSPEEMGQRARAFTSRGYQAHAVYVDIPTEEAMKRAASRAVNAKDDSDRRMIPEVIMRSVHRDVAATVPSLPGYLDDHQIPLKLEVWNNNQGVDETGNFKPPVPIFSYEGGKRTVLDQPQWDAFVGKGHETILHVDAPAPTAAKPIRSDVPSGEVSPEQRQQLASLLPSGASTKGEDHPLQEIHDALVHSSPDDKVHVKTADGQVSSAISFTHSSPYADGHTRINNLGSTKKGEGMALVQRAIDAAAGKGEGVHAEAVPSAAGFYKKLGFKESGKNDSGYPIFKLSPADTKKKSRG